MVVTILVVVLVLLGAGLVWGLLAAASAGQEWEEEQAQRRAFAARQAPTRTDPADWPADMAARVRQDYVRSLHAQGRARRRDGDAA